MAKTTENTAPPADATDKTEKAPIAETVSQETQANEIAAKLAEAEVKLKEFADLQTKFADVEKAKKESDAEAMRWQASYKGLQQTATQKLQEAAKQRDELTTLQQNRAELAEIKDYLATLASRVLDESERKDFEMKQRENRLKAQAEAYEQRLKELTQKTEPTSGQQVLEDPMVVKKQFLDYYFGPGLDPTDPTIDWADDVQNNTPEAFRRLTQSVMKIKFQKDEKQTQDIVSTVQKQAEEAIQAMKVQSEALQQSTKDEIVKAKEEALKIARDEQEKRLRSMGIDVGTIPVTEPVKNMRNRVETELDEKLLYQGEPGSMKRKQGEQEYQRRLELIRKQILGG